MPMLSAGLVGRLQPGQQDLRAHVFNLALAILPAAPLFAVKKLPPFAVKNSRSGYRPGSKSGAQQKLSS